MLTDYKARVAPIYRTQMDQHLFATASPRRPKKDKSGEKAWREWLRERWSRRAASWQSESSES